MKRLLMYAGLALVVTSALRAQQLENPGKSSAGEQARARAIRTDEATEARVTHVASQLRCVVCQGQALQDSPSELAQQMKDVIREQLVAGKSEKEVIAYFVGKYGEWILLEPQPHGFNWLAWVLPPLLLVGGGAALVLRMRRWTQKTAAPTA